MTLLATLSRFSGFGRISKTSFTRHLNLAKQRKDLAQLTPSQLEDIGVTQAEAQREATRPLWDAPNFWYK